MAETKEITDEQRDALLKKIADGYPLGSIPHADAAWAMARGTPEFPDIENPDQRAYVRNRWVSIVSQAVAEKEQQAKEQQTKEQQS